jgi:hypothetical protein
MMKCEDCRFFSNEWIGKPDTPGERWPGECRRHAPSPASITYQISGDRSETQLTRVWNAGCDAMWPQVQSDHWCGEYGAKSGIPEGMKRMRDGTLQPLGTRPTTSPLPRSVR